MLQGGKTMFFLMFWLHRWENIGKRACNKGNTVFLPPENTKAENYINYVNWSNSEAAVLYSTTWFIIPGALRQHFALEFKDVLSYEVYAPLQNNTAE